jgi:hypothetical protein
MKTSYPRELHPLEQICDLMETAFGEENPELIDLMIAESLNRPLRDYTSNYYAAASLIPSGWRVEWWNTMGKFRCLLRKGDEVTTACADQATWALSQAAIDAIKHPIYATGN